MSDPIRRSAIYNVPDTSVTFPPRTLKERNIKPTRPFLVLSNDQENSDPGWPVVLGFPISTAPDFKSEFDVEVQPGDNGLTDDCWIQIVMLQPLAKTKLQARRGQLSALDMERVVTNLARYIELIERGT